ncbi:MAG: hypothetical protein ACKPKO_61665, partial [Candidatus Fonsibacter sp.]
PELARRAAIIKLRGRIAPIMMMGVIYLPPRPTEKGSRPFYEKGVRALFKWWDEGLHRHRGRSVKFFGLDLNDMLGLSREGRAWVCSDERHIGQCSPGRQGFAADMLQQFMVKWHLKAVSTFLMLGTPF